MEREILSSVSFSHLQCALKSKGYLKPKDIFDAHLSHRYRYLMAISQFCNSFLFCINANHFCTGKIPKHEGKQDRSSGEASLFIRPLLGAGRRGRSGVCCCREASSSSTAQALQPLSPAQLFIFTQHFTSAWSRVVCALGGRG